MPPSNESIFEKQVVDMAFSGKVVAVQTEKQKKNEPIYFPEALERTGYGMFNYCVIFLGGLVMICTFIESSSIGFILPIAECDLKLSNQDKGILSTVGFIGTIVSSHLWGFLADTKGRRAVILPSLFISSTVSILASFSHTLWLLIVLRFLNGFFISASFAAFFVYIGEFHNDHTRTRAIMASSCILSIGAMLLPMVCWGVLNQSWSLPMPFLGIVYKPWRLLLLIGGCPGIVAGLIMLLLPESPKFLLSIGKQEEAIKALKQMHSWNVRSGELEINQIIPDKDTLIQEQDENLKRNSSFLYAFLHTVWKQTVPLFEKSLLLSTVLICTIQFWMYFVIHGLFIWYPFITETMVNLLSQNSANGTTTGICSAIHANHLEKQNILVEHECTEKLQSQTFMYSILMEFFYGLAFVVIGVMARKVQKNHMLFIILLVFGTCGVMVNFVFDATFALISYNMFFLSGVGIQVLSGVTLELYPTHLRAMAICISLMFGRLGGVAGANIAGILLAKNCEMVFYIAGVGVIVSAFLTFLIPKIKNHKDEENVTS